MLLDADRLALASGPKPGGGDQTVWRHESLRRRGAKGRIAAVAFPNPAGASQPHLASAKSQIFLVEDDATAWLNEARCPLAMAR